MAVGAWLRRQADIIRIGREFPEGLVVLYEDLCDATDATLARIHRRCGLEPEPFDGNLRTHEHHILGNDMRLRSATLKLDTQWRAQLAPRDREIVDSMLGKAIAHAPDPALQAIIKRYLET